MGVYAHDVEGGVRGVDGVRGVGRCQGCGMVSGIWSASAVGTGKPTATTGRIQRQACRAECHDWVVRSR